MLLLLLLLLLLLRRLGLLLLLLFDLLLDGVLLLQLRLVELDEPVGVELDFHDELEVGFFGVAGHDLVGGDMLAEAVWRRAVGQTEVDAVVFSEGE